MAVTAPQNRDALDGYWARDAGDLARLLSSGPGGLSSADAAARLREHGPNSVREHHPLSRVAILLNQVRSPLLLLLIFAAGASAMTREWVDAAIVLTVVVATVAVGYSREYSAHAAAAALQARIHLRARALRDGVARSVPVEELVPGDVVSLSAGSLVPADGVLFEAADFFVSEAVLTGESFPVEKEPGISEAHAAIAGRTSCVFLGSNVRSGTARFLVVRTGAATELGAIAGRLMLAPPETEFERGIRHFGYLLTSAMLVLVILVFAAHVLQGRPAVETLLFSIALAVGLSPELLPAILTVNLARGARMMATRGVLVRRLNAIENLGGMDVLCTDKTGTLTEGVIRVEGAYDPAGAASIDPLDTAACSAALDTGLDNPLDEAVINARKPDVSSLVKLAEIPFDATRKRASVVVRHDTGARLLTKGAFNSVLAVCTRLRDGVVLDNTGRHAIAEHYARWSASGLRVIAAAVRDLPARKDYSFADEHDMTFVGFVTFLDQPKEGVTEALQELARLGVSVKVITGDNELVSRHVASLVGLRCARVVTGRDLDRMPDMALWHNAEQVDMFVEVDPRQKERIIAALRRTGHVVGFLGDGVNDAPAMHAADTSLSVEQAVDVAREAADFVLLERGLDVIRRGIEEGRQTFANTLKYILTTTSANLGNMLSMAFASLMLPFLPLLAGQILLNNFLSDIPAIGLADDSVDAELVERPGRWDIGFIGRFMVLFGIVSSVFDFVTFGVLLFVFVAPPEVFRTTWFVESLLTELLVALVVRTRRPFFRSRPGHLLVWLTAVVVAAAFAIPYLPFADLFGFVPLPGRLLLTTCGIAVLYVIATELAKRWMYRAIAAPPPRVGAWLPVRL